MSRSIEKNSLTKEKRDEICKKCVVKMTPNVIYRTGGRRPIKPQAKTIITLEECEKYYKLPFRTAKILGFYSHRLELEPKVGFSKNTVTLRHFQENAIFLSLEKIKKYKTLLIKFPPGFGKTITAISLWRYIRNKTVILINRSTLIESWKNTISLCFGEDHNIKVWIVGEDKVPEYDADIIICMAQRFKHIPEEVRLNVGTMIVDEAHLFCTPSHIKPLLSFSPNYIIFATATPVKNDGSSQIIDHFIEKDSWLTYVSKRPYIVHSIFTGFNLIDMCRENEKEVTYQNKYKFAHRDSRRNDLIKHIVKLSQEQQKKCMVLTTTQEHVKILSEHFSDLDCVVAEFYKNIKTCSNYNVLIGTVPKIGTGYDEATVCKQFDNVKSNVLILCTSIKSENLFEQLIGRIMRGDAPHVVWLIDDDSNPKHHLYDMLTFIKQTNGSLRKHDISDIYEDGIDFSEKISMKCEPYELIS